MAERLFADQDTDTGAVGHIARLPLDVLAGPAVVAGVHIANIGIATAFARHAHRVLVAVAPATVRATDDFAFTSDSVTVTVGQAVCWENAGRQIYTVTDTGTSGCRFDTPTRTAHLDQGPSGSSD